MQAIPVGQTADFLKRYMNRDQSLFCSLGKAQALETGPDIVDYHQVSKGDFELSFVSGPDPFSDQAILIA